MRILTSKPPLATPPLAYDDANQLQLYRTLNFYSKD